MLETHQIKRPLFWVFCGATGNTMMWWWMANSNIAPHVLYKVVLNMSTAALFLYVKAWKAGRSGRQDTTSFHSSASISDTLCVRACRKYPCNGYIWLNQKKAYGVITSCRDIQVAGPQKSMLECHTSMLAQIIWLQVTPQPFSIRSAESNKAITSKGSTGNLYVWLLCFCTQILKRGFPGLAQMVM